MPLREADSRAGRLGILTVAGSPRLQGPRCDSDHVLEVFGRLDGSDWKPVAVLIRLCCMPNDAQHQVAVPPEPTSEEVREMAYRAIADCREAKAKAYDLLSKSHDLLRRVDELLARRSG